MSLLFIRHAIAQERSHWDQPDQLRPLTAKGHGRFTKAVRGMAKIVPKIHHLYSSEYIRALQSGEIIQSHYAPAIHTTPHLNPHARLQFALELVRSLPLTEVTCLVGHNPLLETLLSHLLAAGDPNISPPNVIKMRKGQVALLRVNRNNCHDYHLAWHLTQKQLAML